MAVSVSRKQKWMNLSQKNKNAGRAYSLQDCFQEGEVIQHKKFGTGFVKNVYSNKIKVLFEDKNRVLVHRLAV